MALEKLTYLCRIMVAVIVTCGCIMTSQVQAQDRTVTPVEVVGALLAAMKQNDGVRIAAVFAEDAGQAYGQGRLKSGDAFRTWLQSDIIAVAGRVSDPVITPDAANVVVTGMYQNANGYRSPADVLFTVEDGKIAKWTLRY